MLTGVSERKVSAVHCVSKNPSIIRHRSLWLGSLCLFFMKLVDSLRHVLTLSTHACLVVLRRLSVVSSHVMGV